VRISSQPWSVSAYMRMADRAPTLACKLNQSPEEGKRKWRESEEKVKREVKSNSEEREWIVELSFLTLSSRVSTVLHLDPSQSAAISCPRCLWLVSPSLVSLFFTPLVRGSDRGRIRRW
jgi:hypothetical protein